MSLIIRYLMQRVWASITEADKEKMKILPKVQGAECEKLISYKKDGDAYNILNLYYPLGHGSGEKLPTLIVVHGGGWMNGTAETNDLYCRYMASKGFAVMAMSYRLLPKVNLQSQVQDVFDSIRWLEKFGPERGFDLDRLLITGDSAGGHIASLTCAINSNTDLQKAYDVKPLKHSFSALCINHGVCFTDDFNAMEGYVGDMVNRNLRNMMVKRAPWIRNLTSFNEYSQGAAFPPIMVIGSACDVYYPQTRRLCAYLDEKKIPYTSFVNDDESATHLCHVYNITYPLMKESREVNDKVIAHFREICRSS